MVQGDIRWHGESVLRDAASAACRRMRGREIGLIVANPRSHLHPLKKVGRQIEAVYTAGRQA